MHYSISDYIFDLTENSMQSGADLVQLSIKESTSEFDIKIKDNGKGMDEQTLERAMDPFYSDGKKHAKRKVGLGLPFLKQLVESTEGSFSIDSAPGKGTQLEMVFPKDHIDLPPLGDLTSTLVGLMTYSDNVEFVFEYESDNNKYTVKRSELCEVLGELNSVDSYLLMKQYISSLENE